MQVVLAESYGMCFGVRDALAMAMTDPEPVQLTVLGELAHNPQIQTSLRSRGVSVASGWAAPVETAKAMITAHGAPDSVRRSLRESGLDLLDATCPLVSHAHRCLDRLVEGGYFPVVIGKRDHVEVRGLVGDLADYAVVQDEEDIAALAGHNRLGVVSQTTQPLDRVLALLEAIRRAHPTAEVRFLDTVCQPTKERQLAARRLAQSCDVIIVVGGRNSNNTRELAARCGEHGARVHQIEHAVELDEVWLDGARSVGLTAGTSTPEATVAEVHSRLREIAARLDMRAQRVP